MQPRGVWFGGVWFGGVKFRRSDERSRIVRRMGILSWTGGQRGPRQMVRLVEVRDDDGVSGDAVAVRLLFLPHQEIVDHPKDNHLKNCREKKDQSRCEWGSHRPSEKIYATTYINDKGDNQQHDRDFQLGINMRPNHEILHRFPNWYHKGSRDGLFYGGYGTVDEYLTDPRFQPWNVSSRSWKTVTQSINQSINQSTISLSNDQSINQSTIS